MATAAQLMPRFRRTFAADLEEIRLWGPPYALVRFGDGERALMENRPIEGIDGWRHTGHGNWLSQPLRDAASYDGEGYYVATSCPCCDLGSYRYYCGVVTVPADRWTFANLFVNANWNRWTDKLGDMRRFTLVASEGGDIPVPANAVEHETDLTMTLGAMFASRKPILISAGPLAKVLVHRYWQSTATTGKRQIVIDAGSSLDPWLKGRQTRPYQNPKHPDAKRVCRWMEEVHGRTDAANPAA